MGFTLDAMDWMLLALTLPLIQKTFDFSLPAGGLLATATLAGAAVGGAFIGILADYYGRVRILTWTMGWYAIFTAACGFAQSYEQLLCLRFVVGLGLGGEWGVGATLVSEYWPAKYRGRANALVQSGWCVGYGLASLAFMYIVPAWGWRALFLLGIIPAFIAVWVRRSIPEPQEWIERKQLGAVLSDRKTEFPLTAMFSRTHIRKTIFCMVFTSGALMAYWGSAAWIPSFLYTTMKLDIVRTGGYLIVLNAGAIVGYQFFGWLADAKGRRFASIAGLSMSVVVTVIYVSIRDPQTLLLFGPVFGFATNGNLATMGSFLTEMFPVELRATATNFLFNVGRAMSMLSPYIIGMVGTVYGLGIGIGVTALLYMMGVFGAWMLPETRVSASFSQDASTVK